MAPESTFEHLEAMIAMIPTYTSVKEAATSTLAIANVYEQEPLVFLIDKEPWKRPTHQPGTLGKNSWSTTIKTQIDYKTNYATPFRISKEMQTQSQ